MGVGDQGLFREGGGVILSALPRVGGQCLTSPLGGAGLFALLSTLSRPVAPVRGPSRPLDSACGPGQPSVLPAGLSCKTAPHPKRTPLDPHSISPRPAGG